MSDLPILGVFRAAQRPGEAQQRLALVALERDKVGEQLAEGRVLPSRPGPAVRSAGEQVGDVHAEEIGDGVELAGRDHLRARFDLAHLLEGEAEPVCHPPGREAEPAPPLEDPAGDAVIDLLRARTPIPSRTTRRKSAVRHMSYPYLASASIRKPRRMDRINQCTILRQPRDSGAATQSGTARRRIPREGTGLNEFFT